MAYVSLRMGEVRKAFELGSETLIGRGTSCDVLLDDPRSSKRHASIGESGGQYVLTDLNSTNGTLVNTVPLTGSINLKDGDEVAIGSTRLVYTRGLPPGAELVPAGRRSTTASVPPRTESGLPAPSGSSDTGVQAVARTSDNPIPRGTMAVPLERFALRPGTAVSGKTAEGGEAIPSGPELEGESVSLWLRGLYRLLREANTCETEDELFSVATQVLTEALPNSRVRFLFESSANVAGADALNLSIWIEPGRRESRTTRILEERFAGPRLSLLTYARQRGLALMSPDVESDSRVSKANLPAVAQSSEPRKSRGTTRIKINPEKSLEESRDRLSILIAPLLSGRAAMGYLVAERSYRKETNIEVPPKGETANKKGPFQEAHLEFLAAAAYPLASLWANLRRRQSVQDQNDRLRRTLAGKHQVVGESASLKAALSVAERAAPFNSPVLILGGSGTGKEVFARTIHQLSPRRNGPFEAINCAALPENLIESELFGHSKGSFTGATADRAGCFETASGGTLFLDEIGEMPLSAQAKLLRVLEESKVCRVGENRLRDVDCRIVAATNRDLPTEVAAKRFRQDLYYRLRVMEIPLPSLRERLEDLPLLCRHLLAPFGNYSIRPEVYEVFRRYTWPGNIRELRNTLERMAVLSKPMERGMTRGATTPLNVEDIPLDIRRAVDSNATGSNTQSMPMQISRRRKTAIGILGPDQMANMDGTPPGFNIKPDSLKSLEELQVSYARWVLEQVQGNKSKAAKVLGIQRSTLYAWTEWKQQEKKT